MAPPVSEPKKAPPGYTWRGLDLVKNKPVATASTHGTQDGTHTALVAKPKLLLLYVLPEGDRLDKSPIHGYVLETERELGRRGFEVTRSGFTSEAALDAMIGLKKPQAVVVCSEVKARTQGLHQVQRGITQATYHLQWRHRQLPYAVNVRLDHPHGWDCVYVQANGTNVASLDYADVARSGEKRQNKAYDAAADYLKSRLSGVPHEEADAASKQAASGAGVAR
jgi:hypothetical protein